MLRLAPATRCASSTAAATSSRVVDAGRAKRGVRVRLATRAQPAPEPRVAITLAQAVLKGDKMDDVVRDAVMLGVAAIQPIVTARTEVTRAALVRGAPRALASGSRSRRRSSAAAPIVPRVFEPIDFDELVDALGEVRCRCRR